jgi:hypothetical protein
MLLAVVRPGRRGAPGAPKMWYLASWVSGSLRALGRGAETRAVQAQEGECVMKSRFVLVLVSMSILGCSLAAIAATCKCPRVGSFDVGGTCQHKIGFPNSCTDDSVTPGECNRAYYGEGYTTCDAKGGATHNYTLYQWKGPANGQCETNTDCTKTATTIPGGTYNDPSWAPATKCGDGDCP